MSIPQSAIRNPQSAIIVSRQDLQASLLFASQTEDRYVLCSILIEAYKAKPQPTIISTDGRRLAVIESRAIQEQDFEHDQSLLLRSDFVKCICGLSKAIGGKLFPWIVFRHEPGSKKLVAEIFGGKTTLDVEEGALVEGKFPDWRTCIPDHSAPRARLNDFAINAEFAGDIARVAKIFEVPPIVQFNLIGKDSAIEAKLSGAEHFYGLIMPCKADESVNYQPDFLNLVKDLKPKEDPSEPVAVPANGEASDQTAIQVAPVQTGPQSAITVTITPAHAKTIAKACDAILSEGRGRADVPVRQGGAAGADESKNSSPVTHHSSLSDDEELIQQCIEVIRAEQKASVSLLQRRLRLGYSRAAKIMDELERRQVVGPSKGSEPRDILIDLEDPKEAA